MRKNEATEKVLSDLEELIKFVVASHESLIGGCLPGARPQLTWSRRSLDQVDLLLVLFPRRTGRASVDVGHRTWTVLIDQASPPNAHRGLNRGKTIEKEVIESKSVILDATHTRSRYKQLSPEEVLRNRSKSVCKTIDTVDESMKEKFPEKPMENNLGCPTPNV
ncbi:hypothetical protein [Halobacillus sp. Marseille-P3879]|uniref:hypothetical protein n=1 Tax=Halobacillus sp. Marseille-P3879 TaxID=2045014 RepID=UPI0011AF0FFB|nr:hypothetical protein [Halobacillus sp. Marseille-P3879]